jgi:NADH-quinone oxidoreductase subunit L
MFRLVFLTFHGDFRGKIAPSAHPEEEEHGAHDRPHGQTHGAGLHLHDAPAAMAVALVILAVGSVLAGYVGVPHALGGHNSLGTWLAPAFQVGGEAAESATVGEEGSLELTLMLVSSAIAVLGIGLAWFLWVRRQDLVDGLTRSFSGVHRLLTNKYYVDEVYDAAVVHPIRVISQEGLWRAFDVKIIDGAVNGAGSTVAGAAWALRRLQNGSVRAYAGSLFVGVVLILGYYLWR